MAPLEDKIVQTVLVVQASSLHRSDKGMHAGCVHHKVLTEALIAIHGPRPQSGLHVVPNPDMLARLVRKGCRVKKCAGLGASLIVIAVFLPRGFSQSASYPPTPEESISIKTAGDPKISPDGKYVVYSVREADWKQNEYVSHLWLADVATGRTFQLTRGAKSSVGADWSPDGHWIAFITQREGGANPALPTKSDQTPKGDQKDEKSSEGKPADHQIWLISPVGGEAWQLTKHEKDVGGFYWSKDGRYIAFTAESPETKAAKDRKEKYSDYESVERDYSQNQLWLIDVTAAEKLQAPVQAVALTTDEKLNVNDVAWSPDSSRIAFSATPNPLLSFSQQSDLYLLDLGPDRTSREVHKIVALDGPDTSPVFSPDGNQIAFHTALAQKYDYYLNGHIATVQVDGVLKHPATTPADVSDLTVKFDEDPQLIDWGPDGIYFAALQKTSAHVFRIDPASHEITRMTTPDNYVAEGASFTKDFRQMALAAADAAHMTEIFVSDTTPFAPRKLTDLNAQLSGFMLGSEEVVSWKSHDGTVVEGVLSKPAGYDPAKKYPLLVRIHGGPTGIDLPIMSPADHTYPIQYFLSRGALVLEPNYRGSAGYGEKFRSLNVRNLGVGDMWDVMSGVDALIARGLVDPSRMGVMGWSEGGYISAFLTTHTDRFKAISVGAGISDWMTYYVNTDITPFTRQYLHATPWDDPEIYARTSPISTIRQARTPTLIQQGSNDKRVPVPDSYELYRGLEDQHVPSKLIFYTGFGHGINKPKSNLAVMRANLDWFAHYIWDDPIADDSPLLGSSEVVEKTPSSKP
jgi:dipeptidyl aminopeptidase/acylaminoacyl peptidase